MLENLALHADWCVLSTRIAQVTPRKTAIEEEPVAYLLDVREANDDPTNFWIFSAAGLLRLVSRAGWIVLGHERLGQTLNSNPADPEADERMFVLLKSRPRHPDLLVRPLYGWHAPENSAWRWTAALLGSGGQARVTCMIESSLAGAVTCTKAETLEFRGRFPQQSTRQAIRLDFKVESNYSPGGGDIRDLGVIVPLLKDSPGNTHLIPFRVS